MRKYFVFDKIINFLGGEYKKGTKFEVNKDGGNYDDEGYWLFDYDSLNAFNFGKIVYK